MIRYKIILSFSLICFGVLPMVAQDSANTSGGDAIGSGGSVSYSVGQVFYTVDSSASGKVSKGIQHAYSFATRIQETNLNITLSVFPNPAIDIVKLKIDGNKNQLVAQLFNTEGKLLITEKVNSDFASINMNGLPQGTFVLNVLQDNKIIKSFNIVKS